jgi:hypothetical protein
VCTANIGQGRGTMGIRQVQHAHVAVKQ